MTRGNHREFYEKFEKVVKRRKKMGLDISDEYLLDMWEIMFSDEYSFINGDNPSDFIEGWCLTFATVLSNRFGYDIEYLYNRSDKLVHAYCKTVKDGKTYFIDVRGVTEDYNELVRPFLPYIEVDWDGTYPMPNTTDHELGEKFVIQEETYDYLNSVEMIDEFEDIYDLSA